MPSPLVTGYRPKRPSLWHDLRAIPFSRHGLPMLAVFALVFVYAMLLEIFA